MQVLEAPLLGSSFILSAAELAFAWKVAARSTSLRGFIRSEIDRWTPVIKKAGAVVAP